MKKKTCAAFTLIEMLVVMAIIAILVGLVIGAYTNSQSTAARARAKAEVKAMGAALESYLADNATYPRDAAGVTDSLDPKASAVPSVYIAASLELYKALSGDANANFVIDPGELEVTANGATVKIPPYFEFKPTMLGTKKDPVSGKITQVLYIQDPWGNSYGYSTAGAKREEAYRLSLLTDPAAVRPSGAGYNSTYDLWSTGGSQSAIKATAPVTGFRDYPKWITNW